MPLQEGQKLHTQCDTEPLLAFALLFDTDLYAAARVQVVS